MGTVMCMCACYYKHQGFTKKVGATSIKKLFHKNVESSRDDGAKSTETRVVVLVE